MGHLVPLCVYALSPMGIPSYVLSRSTTSPLGPPRVVYVHGLPDLDEKLVHDVEKELLST